MATGRKWGLFTLALLLAGASWAALRVGEGGPPADEGAEPGAREDSGAPGASGEVDPERVRRLLSALSHDSMEGRFTASEGARKAARLIARELESYGVEPAGDEGFLQTVYLRRDPSGSRFSLVSTREDWLALPEAERALDANVVGIVPGVDPALRDEYVIVGAHFDHVGIGAPAPDSVFGDEGELLRVERDSIYNGADDDASGVVTVLEVARALATGEPPGRSVILLLSTGEERGLLGTNYYIQNPVVPLESTVADLQIEMIGRPDSLAGGPGHAWLTGYERSTMGDMLRESGSPLVPDPRPEQNFFMRSDNIAFARLGIPAHTLSSFNLHSDYHRPSDEWERADFGHMAAVIEATIEAVRNLARGPRAEWHPGGRPGGGEG